MMTTATVTMPAMNQEQMLVQIQGKKWEPKIYPKSCCM